MQFEKNHAHNGALSFKSLLLAIATAILSIIVVVGFVAPVAYAQEVNIPVLSGAKTRSALLNEMRESFGMEGIYITTLANYDKESSLESYSEDTLRFGISSIGEDTTRMYIMPGKKTGNVKVRIPNVGYTSDGTMVDLVATAQIKLADECSVPIEVFKPSTLSMHCALTNEHRDELRANGDTLPGNEITVTLNVYKHGTTTAVSGNFALMFNDLDVTGEHGSYDDLYTESVELLNGFSGGGYRGDKILESDGHVNTQGNPAGDGKVLDVVTRNGNTVIRATHDCGELADASVVLGASNGAKFIWRGHSCGTSIGIVNAAPKATSFDATVLKRMEGAALTANQFSFELLDPSGKVIQTKKNSANGRVDFSISNITKPGSFVYKIREVDPNSDAIEHDTHVESLTINVVAEGNALKVVGYNFSGGGAFVNKAKPGRIDIVKTDAQTKSEQPQGDALLKGAKFTVYSDSACKNSTGVVITIGENGKGYAESVDITPLNNPYYLKETTAPLGYTMNSKVFKVNATAA